MNPADLIGYTSEAGSLGLMIALFWMFMSGKFYTANYVERQEQLIQRERDENERLRTALTADVAVIRKAVEGRKGE